MTRPSSTEDLDEYDVRGHRVATIPSHYITTYPSLGMHLLGALAEAGRLGLDVEDGEITIPLTEKELATKIKSAQRTWDLGKGVYEKYLEDGQWPDSYWVWSAYLKAEGIAVPKKPEANR